jgi:hypothetical protein
MSKIGANRFIRLDRRFHPKGQSRLIVDMGPGDLDRFKFLRSHRDALRFNRARNLRAGINLADCSAISSDDRAAASIRSASSFGNRAD